MGWPRRAIPTKRDGNSRKCGRFCRGGLRGHPHLFSKDSPRNLRSVAAGYAESLVGNRQDVQNCKVKQTQCIAEAPLLIISQVLQILSKSPAATTTYSDAGLSKSVQHALQCLLQTGTPAIQ